MARPTRPDPAFKNMGKRVKRMVSRRLAVTLGDMTDEDRAMFRHMSPEKGGS